MAVPCFVALFLVGIAAGAADLGLGAPRLFNQGRDLRLLVLNPDTALAYEIQASTNLGTSSLWLPVQLGYPGQTNFVLGLPSNSPLFFRLRVPAIAAPRQLTVPEDVSLALDSVRIQLPAGANAQLSLRATNGFFFPSPTGSNNPARGAGTSLLSLDGPVTSLGDLRYQPASNFFGRDRLTITLTNRAGQAGSGELVSIELLVTPVNDAPRAFPDTFLCAEDTTLTVPAPGVLANDEDVESDPLSAALIVGPAHGVATLNPDGSFLYLPDPSYTGPDQFTYRAADATDESGDALVTIQVLPVNDPPTILITSPSAGESLAEGRAIRLRVSVSDPDGSLARVDYFSDAARIATATQPPFEALWNVPAAGRHVLTAQAVDDSGATAVSPALLISVDPDCDHDGVSDSAEMIQGTDPCDFFNGTEPQLTVVDGNFQSGPPGTVLPRPLVIRVSNRDGSARTAQPVVFAVAESDAVLSPAGGEPWNTNATVWTDSAGLALLWLKLPGAWGTPAWVRVSVTNGTHRSQASLAATALGPQEAWVFDDLPVSVCAGGEHTLALLADGTVRAWGRNEAGQLGEGIDPLAVPFSAVPLQVPNLSNVTAIAAGAWHSLALKADGTVLAWGEFREHHKPTPPPGLAAVTAIAAGTGHDLALLANGTVRAWGDPYALFAPPPGLAGVTAVAAGRGFSLALRADGTVVAWGGGPFDLDYGQTRIPPGLSGVSAIAAGDYHGLALRSDGTVAAWGANQFGQATPPADLSRVIAIAAGDSHSLAWQADGRLRSWGRGPTAPSAETPQPGEISAIAAGGVAGLAHDVALRADGSIWSWGDNSFGQLGDGSRAARVEPVRAVGLSPEVTFTNPVPFLVHTPLR